VSISLSLSSAGDIFLNDKPVTLEALPNELQRVAIQKPEVEVQLRADQAVPYGQVLNLMGLAQQAGLTRIGFVTAPGATQSPSQRP
jgi:biopolymer transport protein TolR